MDAEIVRPASRLVGSPEYIQTVVSLAARWAKHIDQDCRPFAEQCQKLLACQAWETFFHDGEKSWERLCDEALKLHPDFVAKIVEGVDILEGKQHEGPMPQHKVLEASATYQGERVNFANLAKSSQQDRAASNEVSHYTQRKLDRLARDYPSLLSLVREGKLSTHAAAKEAGFVKDPTPLQLTQRAWKHATLDDKRLIVRWIQDRLQDDPALLENLG